MSADRTALNILLSVTRDGAFANLALKEGLSYVRPNEVGRTTALVYTALENLNYCDFIIDHYAKGRLHTAVRGILRIAVAELTIALSGERRQDDMTDFEILSLILAFGMLIVAIIALVKQNEK